MKENNCVQILRLIPRQNIKNEYQDNEEEKRKHNSVF